MANKTIKGIPVFCACSYCGEVQETKLKDDGIHACKYCGARFVVLFFRSVKTETHKIDFTKNKNEKGTK